MYPSENPIANGPPPSGNDPAPANVAPAPASAAPEPPATAVPMPLNEPAPRQPLPHWFIWPPLLVLMFLLGLWIGGCSSNKTPPPVQPGDRLQRAGDEIVACGQLFHTNAPVVLWTDPGGYDAYRIERRFVPYPESSWGATTRKSRDITSPNRYSLRASVLSTEEISQVRGGGWPLELLQAKVDQFVIHYDAAGSSQRCFKILHDMRNLSVHFMLDLDGTIYQTLDLKERAWHAGEANSRSIGIEIANIGAYAADAKPDPLEQWYKVDDSGLRQAIFPAWVKDPGIRTPNFIARPCRNDAITGQIHGRSLHQYDLTPQQYDSLIKLTATLCTILPKIKCDYPRDAAGNLITARLPDDRLQSYQGLLGHYHLTVDKIDPGPAFQWDRVVDEARKLMTR